jgi:nucleotide-binding universal stress UspA family protein
MKILIGLEAPEEEKKSHVLTLLSRLAFLDAQRTLIYVLPYVTSAVWHIDPLLGVAEAERCERLAQASPTRYLARLDPKACHRVVMGHPAGEILAEADRQEAELIAVNASNRGMLETLVTGSVARGLVAGASQSVLLVRPSEKIGAVRAVFATDHSEYANKCLETLIRLAPPGIGQFTVLTAYYEEQPQVLTDIVMRSESIIERLRGKIGSRETTFRAHIAPGKPREVIAQAMAQTGTELLILGAKGHSMVERLMLGSVSFEQAIGEHPYSVLILKA